MFDSDKMVDQVAAVISRYMRAAELSGAPSSHLYVCGAIDAYFVSGIEPEEYASEMARHACQR